MEILASRRNCFSNWKYTQISQHICLTGAFQCELVFSHLQMFFFNRFFFREKALDPVVALSSLVRLSTDFVLWPWPIAVPWKARTLQTYNLRLCHVIRKVWVRSPLVVVLNSRTFSSPLSFKMKAWGPDKEDFFHFWYRRDFDVFCDLSWSDQLRDIRIALWLWWQLIPSFHSLGYGRAMVP